MRRPKFSVAIFALTLPLILSGCASKRIAASPKSENLVILHSNDTHSHIDPEADIDLGGVARRKVLIDSVRQTAPNVLLVDAGDIVQGTLYFHLYKGKVEQEMINELGYDVQILGNHEFDNGMGPLRDMLSKAKPTLLATNYDLSESNIGEFFQPYMIKEYGKHKVGIFALNLDPKGMVAEGNYDGVKYLPWKETVEKTVDFLRNKQGCDRVIAVTHIGYTGSDENPDLFGDVQVAQQTSGIDLIIGGHSHTKLNEGSRVVNAKGDTVLIVQTGKYGRDLGEINFDLASGKITERLIPVNGRLDSRRDEALLQKLEPYRAGVDSLYNHVVAKVITAEPLTGRSPAMQNFAADFILNRGSKMISGVDGAVANKGGLRTTWNPGDLTEGSVIDMMPFYNKIVVIDIKGSDLKEAFDVMKARGGDGVAGITDKEQIDPDKTYRIATIDYLAKGGDYMTPFTRAKVVAGSPLVAYDDLLEYLKENPVVNPDNTQRMILK